MISAMNLFLMLYSGAAIAGGQALMSILSRRIAPGAGAWAMAAECASSWELWVSIALYASGMLAMFLLLRALPLAQASVGIWAVTILCNVALTAALGQSLGLAQYAGIALVFGGMVLLQRQ
jgi:drug/metabolite transporter (DMT)-like permease